MKLRIRLSEHFTYSKLLGFTLPSIVMNIFTSLYSIVDGYLHFAPIINWGKYREENSRLMMPLTIRMNHAIADGFLLANVYRLLENHSTERSL